MQENLERQIKKHIYAKKHTFRITFPSGFSETCHNEIKEILETSFVKEKELPEIEVTKKDIKLTNSYLLHALEIMLRSQTCTDLRMLISSTKTFSKIDLQKSLDKVNFKFFLNDVVSVKLRVNSVASKLFHEGAIKEIVKAHLEKNNIQVVAENIEETSTDLFIELYKDQLNILISLLVANCIKEIIEQNFNKVPPCEKT